MTNPFTTRISTVRILGGWTGDNGTEDVAFRLANGTLQYRWNKLHERLQPVIGIGLSPLVVLDNVPWCFTKNAVHGTYGNVMGPDDPQEYGVFLEALVREIVRVYGKAAAESWQWRFGTEPNCLCHWQDTVAKWIATYQVAEHAVHSMLPGVLFGPGNFCNYLPFGPTGSKGCNGTTMEAMVEALRTTRARVGALGMSLYGGKDPTYSPGNAAKATALLVRARQTLGLKASTPLGFYEFGTLANPFGRRSPEPGAFGAAWTLAAWAASVHALDSIFHWGYNDNFGQAEDGNDALLYSSGWLMAVAELMVGEQQAVSLATPITSTLVVSGLASGVLGQDESAHVLLSVLDSAAAAYASNATVRVKVVLPKERVPCSASVQVHQYALTLDTAPYDTLRKDLVARGYAQFNDGRVYSAGTMATKEGGAWLRKNLVPYKQAQAHTLKKTPFVGQVQTTDIGVTLEMDLRVQSTVCVEVACPHGR